MSFAQQNWLTEKIYCMIIDCSPVNLDVRNLVSKHQKQCMWTAHAEVILFFPWTMQAQSYIQHRRRKRGGQAPPNNLRGGANIPFGPPNNPPTCTGKTIPLNSILEFSIISYFKMSNVIIWHWFIKNLVGTRRRNDVDATSLRRIDVVTTSCACWEFGPPPWPPKNSKPCPPPIF